MYQFIALWSLSALLSCAVHCSWLILCSQLRSQCITHRLLFISYKFKEFNLHENQFRVCVFFCLSLISCVLLDLLTQIPTFWYQRNLRKKHSRLICVCLHMLRHSCCILYLYMCIEGSDCVAERIDCELHFAVGRFSVCVSVCFFLLLLLLLH